MPYILNESTSQIISPLGTVVADLHGLGTPEGRCAAEAMLRALNYEPERLQALRRLRAEARSISEGGLDAEGGLRRLAALVSELVKEVAR